MKQWKIKSHQSYPQCGVQASREASVEVDCRRGRRKQKKHRQSGTVRGRERLFDAVREIYGDAMDGEESQPLPNSNSDGGLQAAGKACAAPAGKEKGKHIVSKTMQWKIKSHQSDPQCAVQASREASAAEDLKGGQRKQRKYHKSDTVPMSESGELSPGEDVIARPKRQRKTKKHLLDAVRGIYRDAMDGEESQPPPASDSDGDLQAVGQASSSPARKEKGKRIGFITQQTKSSPSHPGQESNLEVLKGSPGEKIARPEQLQHFKKKKKEAQDDDKEEAREASASFEEGTHFGDLVVKVAQDADKEEAREITLEEETPYRDVGKVAHDDAEKIDNDIDSKQVQEAGKIKALLDLDDITVSDQIRYYCDQLNCCLTDDDDDFWADYDEVQLTEVYERLALYRIKAHIKAHKGIELDIATLKRQYPLATLQDEGYFEHYERSLGWYFDDERCKIAGLEDYQRLMLYEDDLYQEWDFYQGTYSTYKGDEEYVQFWEVMSEETKWIEDYLLKPEWEKCKRRAYYQYLEIATRFHYIFANVALHGFREYIWSMKYDFFCYKKLYALYLEIWKRVAKKKMNFADALREIYDEDMFPLCRSEMEIELQKKNPVFCKMKNNYDAYVACIDEEVSEDDALPLIINAVKKMTPKPKIYFDYARKKVAIADAIGLIRREKSS